MLLCINGLRSLHEKLSNTELEQPEVIIPITWCNQVDNFMKYEPCWRDYAPRRNVDIVRDLYRYSENGGGKILSETMDIDGHKFNNPMLEIMNNQETTKFFLFKNLSAGDTKMKDIYIMPTDPDDADDLDDLHEYLVMADDTLDEDEQD